MWLFGSEWSENERAASAYTQQPVTERPEISCPLLSISTQFVALPTSVSKLPPSIRAPHGPIEAPRVAPSNWCSLSGTLHTALYSCCFIILRTPETREASPEKPGAFVFSEDSEWSCVKNIDWYLFVHINSVNLYKKAKWAFYPFQIWETHVCTYTHPTGTHRHTHHIDTHYTWANTNKLYTPYYTQTHTYTHHLVSISRLSKKSSRLWLPGEPCMRADWEFRCITFCELFILCTYLTNIQTDKTPVSGPSFHAFMWEWSDGAQLPQTLHVFDFAHKLKVRILVCVLSHSGCFQIFEHDFKPCQNTTQIQTCFGVCTNTEKKWVCQLSMGTSLIEALTAVSEQRQPELTKAALFKGMKTFGKTGWIACSNWNKAGIPVATHQLLPEPPDTLITAPNCISY